MERYLPKSCVGLAITKISFGSLDRHPVSMDRISWLKFKTAISLLASAHDNRLFDSLSFLYGLCKITLSVLVTAVRHTWMPSYLPNFTLPTKMRFKLNEKAGFIENDIVANVVFVALRCVSNQKLSQSISSWMREIICIVCQSFEINTMVTGFYHGNDSHKLYAGVLILHHINDSFNVIIHYSL